MSRLLWSYQSLSQTIILISLNCILILVPATRSSERSQGVKYDSCTGISNIFSKLQSKIDEMFPFQFWWQSQSKQRIKGTAVTTKSASSMMLLLQFLSEYKFCWSAFSLHYSRFVCFCYQSWDMRWGSVWDDGISAAGTNEHHTLIIHGCKDDTGLILSLARVPQTRISPTSSPCIDRRRLA